MVKEVLAACASKGRLWKLLSFRSIHWTDHPMDSDGTLRHEFMKDLVWSAIPSLGIYAMCWMVEVSPVSHSLFFCFSQKKRVWCYSYLASSIKKF